MDLSCNICSATVSSKLNTSSGPLCEEFGVPFLKFPIAIEPETRKALIDKGYFLYEKMREKNKSNMGGFHSEEIFEHDWNSFEAGQWFANTINKKLKQAVRILHNTNTPTIELELTNSWYIISRAKKSDWALPHTHPGSYLSGSFYLS